MARLPLLALALCMFLIGGAFVARAALHGPSGTAATSAPSEASATASSTTGSGADAPGDAPSLSQAVQGRADELAKLAKKAQRLSVQRKTARPVAEFTFAQFNVQGATHRGNIGLRTALARDLLNKYGAQVAALQEFTGAQQRIFTSITGGAWGCYPCQSGPKPLDGEDSVVWRKDRFDALSLDTRPYPYFHGAIRNMPRVLLRDKKSGAQFYVTSYHNPADVHGNAAGFRAVAVGRQVADANAVVKQSKLPLIVSGDMNDRATYFCKMAGGTGMHSADGSSYSGGCRVARSPWIDWIMGTPDVEFTGYLRDDGATAHRSSDHPIVISHVKVTGRAGDGTGANNDADGTPASPSTTPTS